MGYFSPLKRDKNKKYDEQKRNTVYTQTFIYLLVAGYVLYLYKDIYTDFFAKTGTMSLTAFILSSIFMVSGALFLIIFSIITLPKALIKTELPPEEADIIDVESPEKADTIDVESSEEVKQLTEGEEKTND